MKQIIDGKRYNTETATIICQGSSDGNTSRSDFRYWAAALYRTPRGRYFLAGEGGALSMFSRSCGLNSWTGGDGIIPTSPVDALRFAEEHGTGEDLEEFFPDMIEDA